MAYIDSCIMSMSVICVVGVFVDAVVERYVLFHGGKLCD